MAGKSSAELVTACHRPLVTGALLGSSPPSPPEFEVSHGPAVREAGGFGPKRLKGLLRNYKSLINYDKDAFGSKKCAKAAQFRNSFFAGFSAARQPAEDRGSPPRFRLVTRQPAEIVTAFVTAPSGSVFGAKSAENGQLRKVRFSVRRQVGCLSLKFRSFSVESRLQTLTLLSFQPGKQANSIPSERLVMNYDKDVINLSRSAFQMRSDFAHS